MPRIPPVPADFESAKAQAVFDRIRARGEEPSPLYRTLAHAPIMLDAWAALAWPLRTKASVSRALRELMILRLAQLNHAAYQWAYHYQPALASGLSKEQIEALSGWSESSLFDQHERAVLAYAEAIASLRVGDPEFEALATQFGPAEVIELTLTAAFYCGVARLLQALQIEVDRQHEAFLP